MAKAISVTNNGDIAQVVRIRGGTVTIKPGKTVEVKDLITLSDERIVHFENRGVTFGKRRSRNSTAGQKAQEEAKANLENAKAVAQGKIDAAKTALTEAEAELAAAGDEAAKAVAQGKIDAAKQTLASLEGK
jgi:multidrug resistance efflux pump